MTTLTDEDLCRTTLARQFPPVRGTGPATVLELLSRIGPIQSQVPRAPFLAIASRLPGTTYETICELFDAHQLLKSSNLRGTVHTSTRADFGWLDAVGTQTRRAAVTNALRLEVTTADEVTAEVRRFCLDQWRPRAEIVAHVRAWLAEHESPASAERLTGTMAESLIWGNSSLVRRPKDAAWEKRTDTFHRTASALVDELLPTAPEDALVALVRRHLGAYGPMSRRDLSFFFGVGLGQVDGAMSRLADELVRLTGPDGETFVDLAEPPEGGDGDPGLRLLPEFEGLLLGYHGQHRTRFCNEEALAQVWSKVNGVFSPVVLYDGRLVATWRTVTTGRRTTLEVAMLPGGRRPTDDLFTPAVADLQRALPVVVLDVRILDWDGQ